jgi:TonB family protein
MRFYKKSILLVAVIACCVAGLAVYAVVLRSTSKVPIWDAGPKVAVKAKKNPSGKQNSGDLSPDEKAEGLKLLEQARALEFGLNGGAINYAKAFELYKKAAALGSAEAWYRMGRLALGRKVDGVAPKSAVGYFQKAADLGFVDAYVALARAYMEGRLAKTDLAKADFYLDLAVEAGNVEAMFLKGSMLAGSTETARQGLDLLMDAARAGNADAQYTLGRLFRDGTVVARDREAAEKWLRLAAESGSVRAKADLGRLLMKTGGDAASQEVAGLLAEAADAGSSSAARTLARMIYGGKPSNEALGAIREYAEKSFDGGKAEGAFLMALSHAVGKTPDMDQAMQWLEMGRVDQDWRSRYALQLIQNGTDAVEAFKTVVDAKFTDWVDAFDGGKPLPANITPPKIVKMTNPKLPGSMAALNINGNVMVSFVVGENGKPQGIQVVKSSHPELSAAVIRAVETWKLVPATKDGQYAPIKIRVPVRFRNNP